MRDVAVIGTGVMGRGLALNLAENGFVVHAYDKDETKVKHLVDESNKLIGNNHIHGYKSLNELISSTQSPRLIILLITANGQIDLIFDQLKTQLTNSDIVVDAGNSLYTETERRMQSYSYQIIGCGISGGEYGARTGPSMVLGCSSETYKEIKDVFESIAAKYKGSPCCGRVGDGGAGHFVKTVHNGIEYCEMQLIQEIYHLCGGSNKDDEVERVTNLLKGWQKEGVSSFLIELTLDVLNYKENDKRILPEVVDKAKQKGTGKMCVREAIETECAVPAIAESVMARFISQEKERRERFSKLISKNKSINEETSESEEMKQAFLLGKAVSFIQGIDLIRKRDKLKGWDIDLKEVCRIWRAGCIIESDFLERVMKMVENGKDEQSDEFIEIYKQGIGPLRNVCAKAAKSGVPVPVMMSSLAWLDGLGMEKENGQLIQAMRDAFGRHTVELTDGRSTTINWSERL